MYYHLAKKTEARYWLGRSPSPDVYRYIKEIEGEMSDVPIEKTLLDVGNWVYLKNSFLAKDRAISVADQPPAGIYRNIKYFVDRISDKEYDKILVRNFHSPFFPYDWHGWERSSGVRAALEKYYKEVRIIDAPEGEHLFQPKIFFVGPVSVLVPNHDSIN